MATMAIATIEVEVGDGAEDRRPITDAGGAGNRGVVRGMVARGGARMSATMVGGGMGGEVGMLLSEARRRATGATAEDGATTTTREGVVGGGEENTGSGAVKNEGARGRTVVGERVGEMAGVARRRRDSHGRRCGVV
jgi:hypothetical protein